MNYRMIIHTLGRMLMFEAVFLLAPSITSLVYSEWRSLWAFLATALICTAVGVLCSFKSPRNKTLRARDGFVIVSLSWIFLSLFGSLPFLFSGVINNFVDALFETTSGFSTTGATIFADVEVLPRAIIMWRSVTHWVGGMGVLVFVMAFLPLGGGQNMHIMKAESPGPSVSKLVPRVRTTALLLYSIYGVLTLVQFILLLFGDMDVFYAVVTALATAGTGGFGFLNDSMASFSSYIQIVIAVFMLIFSINFNSYFLVLRGRFKEFFTEEVRAFLIMVGVCVALIAFDIRGMYSSFGEGLKHALFNVSAIVSTTGFTSADFDLWPTLSKTLIVILMFIGACAGSTGGGIKMSRILIIVKTMVRELGAAIRPKQIKKIRVDGDIQDASVVSSVCGYMFCFVSVFVVSLVLISLDGADLVTNFTAVTAAIGNIGPGLSKVGPVMNFGFFSPLSKLVLIFDMLAGRLEFFPMLLLFVPSVWKK